MVRILSIFFFVMCFLSLSALEEVTIKADQVTYNDKEKKSCAKGNAVVVRKCEGDDFNLSADTITVLHNSGINASAKGDNYKQVDAETNVLFENDKYTLNADKCILENEKRIVTCTGNGALRDKTKGHSVKGKKIVLNIKDDYYQVFGEGAEKAEVFIFPDKK